MALAVELYFDARTEEAVTALRGEVHAAGIAPSPALEGSRPHISLSVVETDDADLLAGVVSEFAEGAWQSKVRLGAVSSFASGQGVLYLAPVPTLSLLELHSWFHVCLRPAGLESRQLYRPGQWIPHCTLEMGLSGSQLASAFDACWRSFNPIDGRLVAAGVVSFPPPRSLHLIPLRDADESP
ncbi:MAG: 2'-5' RNA ligase family protein [Trueperaceae bacterium]